MIRKLATALAALAIVATNVRANEPAAQLSALEGGWNLVSVDNIQPDGTRTRPYGERPQGALVFDGAGRYALQIYRADRPRFASNDKSRGTAVEYEAAVNGSNAHFGRYALDQAAHSIVFKIDHASYPNWEGTEQTRTFTIDGDLLTYTVPVTTTGGGAVAEVRWQRAR